MKVVTVRFVLAFMLVFSAFFLAACEIIEEREVENNLGVKPDVISVENITLEKGESKVIEVVFEPYDAYRRYKFSVPIDRQEEISIVNGVVTGLKAAATPVPVTVYTVDSDIELQTTFNVKVDGYFDPVDGPIYAFNRMGSFDFPVPASSLDPAATGWSVINNGTESINTLTLSFYDLEEEARDPNSTRWAPRFAHPDAKQNNVKIFDQFEFDVTFSTTLVNVPAGLWYFSMFMEGNNVDIEWNITGLDTLLFPVAATPTWYYQVLELETATTLEFSVRFIGEMTDPDDDKTSPWIFFDSIRAINELAVEYEDDVPPVVEEMPYTNYIQDPHFSNAETFLPLVDKVDYPWKVGPSLRTGLMNISNSQLEIVSSDTNFQVVPDGKSGKFKTVVTSGKTQRFSVYQDLTGIPHNFYTFSAYFMGNPDNQTRENQYFRMFVTYNNINGEEVTVFKNIRTESYFNGYILNVMEGIEITDGRARIGFDFYRSGSSSGGWGNENDCWFQFDDFMFVATNELKEMDIDIYNTWGLDQMLTFNPDLSDVVSIEDTDFEMSGENATLSVNTQAANAAVGSKSLRVTTTEATTVALTQTVSGLVPGETYVFSTHMKGAGAFIGHVAINNLNGTSVIDSAVFLQSYVEFIATDDTAVITIHLDILDPTSIYLDWIIFANAEIEISVEDVANIWVGDSFAPFVQFIPSNKAEQTVFEILSESVVGAIETTPEGLLTAHAAGETTFLVTHVESGAQTMFTAIAQERPLLTSIEVNNQIRPVGSMLSTKLLIVTRTPATAIMGDVTFSLAEGSEEFLTLQGTRITAIAPGVATIIVTALDVNGDPVQTSFTVTVQTIQEANRINNINVFNANARNNVSFAEGGWTVVSNNGGGTPAFSPNNVFGAGALWVKDNPASYNFELTQSFTNMQAGIYTLSLTMYAGVAGGAVNLTPYLNGEAGTPAVFNVNWPAPTLTATVSVQVLENGESVTVGFSIVGNLTGSGSLWGDGVTAINLSWQPLEG